MVKKLSGIITGSEIVDIAFKEAKDICDEDEKFCESILVLNGMKIIEEIYNKNKRYC